MSIIPEPIPIRFRRYEKLDTVSGINEELLGAYDYPPSIVYLQQHHLYDTTPTEITQRDVDKQVKRLLEE